MPVVPKEIEDRLSKLEQRLEKKLELFQQIMARGFSNIHVDLDLIQKDISWIKDQRGWYLIPLGLGILFIGVSFMLHSIP